MDLSNFDLSNTETLTSFKPIPEGEYLACIVAATEKETRAGTGSYLSLEFEILEGKYTKRKLWSKINLKNPSPSVVEFAKKELATIYAALGVANVRDSAELLNKPMVIVVKCKARQEGGELENKIVNWLPRTMAPTAGVQATAGQMPWLKKV